MVAATSLPFADPGERRVLLHGVSWRDYVIVREALDSPGVRMTYLEGALEIMSPSREHELAKKFVARLVETYAFSMRIPLNGHGSTTFEREAKEPDECWVLGRPLDDGESA